MSAISKRIKSWEESIDKVDTCKDLYKLKEDINKGLQDLQNSLTKALSKLEPLTKAIPTPSADPQDLLKSVNGIIEWINNQVQSIQEIIIQINKDVIEIAQATRSLTNKIIDRAITLGCKLDDFR